MAESLSKNAQLLKFFAQTYPGIPRKRLVKLSYMADLVARQFLGHPISQFEYHAYYYGPYSQELPEAIAELETAGLAWSKEEGRSQPDDVARKRLFDTGKPAALDFSLGENSVLGYVVSNFGEMDLDELILDFVYASRPYRAALVRERFNERIPMEIVDNEGRGEVGFDLERAIGAERQADEGQFLTAKDYFDGLRSRIAARYPT